MASGRTCSPARVARAAVRAAKRLRLELDERRARRGARVRRREAGLLELAPALRSDAVGRPGVVEDDVDLRLGRRERGRPRPSGRASPRARGSRGRSGVNSTRTRSPSTSTSRTTPRSTSEITGISGSGISASASQTVSAVTIVAPGTERRTIVISSCSAAKPSACAPRSTASTGSRPTSSRQALALRPARGPRARRARARRRPRSKRARSPVAQSLGPHLGVHPVVGLLAVHLRGEARELGPVRACERRDANRVGRLVEPVACDRARPSRRRAAARRTARSGTRPAARSKASASASPPSYACGELVQGPRVADLALGDRGERDVLLEERRDAGPLGVAPAEHELVVGEGENRLDGRARRCLRAHGPPSA